MKKIAYLSKLLQFAYKNNPILGVFPVISLCSIVAELLAMMVLIPLSSIATTGDCSSRDPIVYLLSCLNVVPSPNALLITFVSLILFRIFTNVLAQSISLKYGKKVLAQMASGAFSNIVTHCGLDEIEKKSIGHYISLAGDESFRSSNLVIEVHQLFSILALVVLYFGLLGWYFPYVAISVGIFLLFSVCMMLSSFRKTHVLGEKQIKESKSAASIFLDSLNGLRTVRSFFIESFVVEKYRNMMHVYTSTLFKIDLINIIIKFSPIALLFLALGTLMATGVFNKHFSTALNYSSVVTVIVFLLRFFPVVGQALNIFMRLLADAKAAKDVTDIIAYKVTPKTGSLKLRGNIQSLKLKKLGFSYDGCPPLFADLHYDFKAGNAYAIVGESGIGKSTLFNLMSFLTRSNIGKIAINGVDSKEYEEESLRKKIILVEQQSIIFNDTIRSNLMLGSEYPAEMVKNACQVACIDSYIAQLKEGLDFELNYQGQNLSGGQRQRLGLARAVLRNPDVLLLDEITSALDSQTKARLLENLFVFFKDKVLIFITHDLDVMKKVDVVLNFEKGRLVEMDSLYRKNEKFAEYKM